ncbi:hypothetical protein ARMGADRAFT_1083469 [Armillaria gallica]|uniref:Uncharacterized protein n=1 Tax=Armillaria gallica TaxID=47427 RepID=A0A2H3D5V5_ARMGA|nr:hypothetical protein ARMGADRAFT_1083469 [Armillaria gallica]
MNLRLVHTESLQCMIGFGPGQLGKVAWIAHCMYEDADGKVCGVNMKIHSKSNSWAAVPDNDLNSEEYFKAAIKWAACGFDNEEDKNNEEGDDDDDEDESAKVQAALANAAAVKKQKEMAAREAEETVEQE